MFEKKLINICGKKGREENGGGGREKEGEEEKKEALRGKAELIFSLWETCKEYFIMESWSTQTPTRLETEDQKRTSVCGD